jgi:hypothetical protein
MKYYSEETVKNLLKEQREKCATEFISQMGSVPIHTRALIVNAPEPKMLADYIPVHDALRKVKVMKHLTAMLRVDTALYEKMMDTPGFAYDFSQITKMAMTANPEMDTQVLVGNKPYKPLSKFSDTHQKEPALVNESMYKKGVWGEKCNRTDCKTKVPAFYYNYATRLYYCSVCAEMINTMNPEAHSIYGHELCLREEIQIDHAK